MFIVTTMNTKFRCLTALLFASSVPVMFYLAFLSGVADISVKLARPLQNYQLMAIEKQVFGSKTGRKTDPKNGQLFYADSVRLTGHYIISKSDYCRRYRIVVTIVFVWSRVDDHEQRSLVRRTWARRTYWPQSRTKVLFVLGYSGDSKVQQRVAKEDKRFGDILQFGFADSYHNCILKSIGVLRWTHLFCKRAKFVMKVDDDMIVNTENLDQFNATFTSRTIYGLVAHNWSAIRNPNHKNYVSEEHYPAETFADFVVAAHIMTSDCVTILYEQCLKTLPALWLEDVYITGILANNTGIRRVNDNRFLKTEWMSGIVHKIAENFNQIVCIGHNFRGTRLLNWWRRIVRLRPRTKFISGKGRSFV